MAEWSIVIGIQFSSLWFFVFTSAASYLIIRFLKQIKQGMNKELPCLPSIPILGSLPFIPSGMGEMCSFYTRKAETVGPVFAFYVGSIIIEFIVIPLHDDNDILHLYMMMVMTFNIYT